jgi:two-component system, chemotaxis family, sensor kinase CheA
MAIDITQFLQTFFEESFEGLETMECGLLHLEVGTVDMEVIHTIFRAAHSIKGGSGTFGLHDVAAFTHVLETLLDEMRDGRRQITQPAVNLLLQSVDCLRDMLIARRDGSNLDGERVAHLQQQCESLLQTVAGREQHQETSLTEGNGQAKAMPAGWRIFFRPALTMLRRGNDPVRILGALETLGDLTVQVDMARLPGFAELDPEMCYLLWELTVQGAVPIEEIREIFAWVEGDCELRITSLQEEPGSPVEETPVSAPLPALQAGMAPASQQTPAGEGAESHSIRERRAGAERRNAPLIAETSSIRVGIDKIDALINMVGELVITQSMLCQLGEHFHMSHLPKLLDGLDQLERNTRELQESVMRIRMLPISFTFQRFPRLVHDLSQRLGKQVELEMSGEQTELDKTVIEKIGDPLLHLVRNAIDHGIEAPTVRGALGKPATGALRLTAYHQGGHVIIEVSDDGAGLNKAKLLHKARERGLIGADEVLPEEEKIYDVIFQPGFSTVETVSDISGRGVGMDVVRRNIRELGGHIEVHSQEGQGTTFTIRLPLTLAILDGQLIRVGQEIYIIPLVSIVESLQIEPGMMRAVAGQMEFYTLRGAHIPIIRFDHVFGVRPDYSDLANTLLVVVEGDGQRVGVVVDELLGQQQVVIKNLESNFKRVEGVAGATILGDGTIALILDVAGVITLSHCRARPATSSSMKLVSGLQREERNV